MRQRFRGRRLWFSTLRSRARTCSVLETRMGIAGTEDTCAAETALIRAASKCLSEEGEKDGQNATANP